MARYTISYDYDWYSLSCECCLDWTSEVHIYDNLRPDNKNHCVTYESCFSVPTMYDEKDLRTYIESEYPEWADFIAHPNNTYA